MELANRQVLYPKVVGLCRHLLGNQALAEETASDIWTDFVLAHADAVKSPAATEAYLRVTTVRRCRRVRMVSERYSPLTAESEPRHASDPERELISADEQRHRRERLTICLEKLDARGRRLLRLRYHNGLTQESIGEHLGVSKQYAGRVLARTLDALRSCVEAA